MSDLRISLFGAPSIERDGEPLYIPARKALALLAYLATTLQRYRRESLCTLLWPEKDNASARANLRNALWALNTAIGSTWIDADRKSIALSNTDALFIDVVEFERLLDECQTHGHPPDAVCAECIAPLTAAANLYRGGFLAGFTLPDSPNFDEWQLFQSERLRDMAGTVFANLVQLRTNEGEFDRAIVRARRWLALDPLNEDAHRQLMLLYAWAGQRSAALRQYETCCDVLDEELGVLPLDETTQLYTEIKADRLPVPPTSTPADTSARVRSRPRTASSGPPLVDRNAEWELLKQCYADSIASGHLAVIEGEAGIGKTRLAEEFVAGARALGARVLSARCYAGEVMLSYGPIAEMLHTALSTPGRRAAVADLPAHWLGEGARLVPELGMVGTDIPSSAPLETPGAQSRFLEGLRQIVLALCAGPQPGIFFLDDGQWADDATVQFLTYLVRRLNDSALFVLVTWRSDELSDDHPLREMVAGARRYERGTTITLSRLSDAGVHELLTSVAPERVQSSAALSYLMRETAGNPFFVVEYAVSLREDGAEAEMPESVRDLLRSRLASVPERSRSVLQLASAIGRAFAFDTLRVASRQSDDDLVDALDILLEHGLIHEIPDGAGDERLIYDFSHDLLRRVTYESISSARRRLLHRAIAEALEEQQGTEGGYAQVAEQYRRAGVNDRAAEYFARAGDHARDLYANSDALVHYQIALKLEYPDVCRLHEAIGDMQTLLGRYASALDSYAGALESVSTDDQYAQVTYKRGLVELRRGGWHEAEDAFAEALECLPAELTHSSLRARIYADWSLTANRRGAGERARTLAEESLAHAGKAGDTASLARAHNILGILARAEGALDDAQKHFEQCLALVESAIDPSAQVATLNNLALVFADAGNVERAAELTTEALTLCASLGDRHREAALHNNLADLLHARGDTEAAMSHLKQAVEIYAEIGREAGTWQPEVWKLTEW